MEILASNEAFKSLDGKFQFHCVKGIIRHNGAIYSAKWTDRRQAPNDFSQLYDVVRVKTQGRGPKFQPSWTVVTGQGCYVKAPDLFAYTEGSTLERRIEREVEMCEMLSRNPHPNFAAYYGCTVQQDRVTGICFKQYASTLLQKVNPGGMNKVAFLASGRPRVDETVRAGLRGIFNGIRHLHSLGVIHNDITPSNIMFDHNGTPVLIDFDSCRMVGESLLDTNTKRSHGWHDPNVKIAVEKNDLDAFAELLNWLFGSSADDYHFQ